jgi:hypothetical protein
LSPCRLETEFLPNGIPKPKRSLGTRGDIDDTTPFDKYYGGDAATLEAGVRGMYAGDGNESCICSIADGNLALADRDSVGYYVCDYNMSGIVTIFDVNLSDSNRDKTTAVN